jgi:hypothetical protein
MSQPQSNASKSPAILVLTAACELQSIGVCEPAVALIINSYMSSKRRRVANPSGVFARLILELKVRI